VTHDISLPAVSDETERETGMAWAQDPVSLLPDGHAPAA